MQYSNGMHHTLWIGRLVLRWWVYRNRYSLSRSGLWPIHIWSYRTVVYGHRGIGFHGGPIADAHIEWNIAPGNRPGHS